MSTIIESIEQRQLRRMPRFAPGDRVRVHFQVVEGTRRRTQVFEGVVIARRGSGARETFTVRKQSFGVGVERTFPVHTPKIERLEVVARGDVRRAKLYYLRGRVGKRARVAERRWGIEDDLVITAPEAEAVDSEGVAQSEAESMPAPEEGEEGEEARGRGRGRGPRGRGRGARPRLQESEEAEGPSEQAEAAAKPRSPRTTPRRARRRSRSPPRNPRRQAEDSEDQELIPRPTTGRGALLELVVIVALAIGLALLIQAFVVKPYQIPSESMEPTLDVGQRVLVDRVSYHFGDPDVGDIVVFHPPAGAENGKECGVRPRGRGALPRADEGAVGHQLHQADRGRAR